MNDIFVVYVLYFCLSLCMLHYASSQEFTSYYAMYIVTQWIIEFLYCSLFSQKEQKINFVWWIWCLIVSSYQILIKAWNTKKNVNESMHKSGVSRHSWATGCVSVFTKCTEWQNNKNFHIENRTGFVLLCLKSTELPLFINYVW